MKQLMIGGQALLKLGNDRSTDDTDYLIDAAPNKEPFIFDRENNIDYVNANGNKFFNEIWKLEADNNAELASPRALLELKAYSLVMHCRNFNFRKADQAEYDMKFLVRTFDLGPLAVNIVKYHVSTGEFSEIIKIINSVKK